MGSSMSSSSSNTQAIRDFIQSENNLHDVVIWSKSYCPYCTQTKNLFQTFNNNTNDAATTDIVVHEIDQHPQGAAIQQELHAMTGQRTVPNVFVQNQHLGGNDDTQRAHRNGELSKMIRVSS